LTSIFLELTGNAYWWIVKDQLGTPREIWHIPSNWVKIIPSKTDFVAGYTIQPPGAPTPTPFDETEIIHFKYPSPFDIFYGTGPLLAARYGVDLNNEIKLYGINFLMNQAQPSGVLTTANTLNEDQYLRLKEQWNARYRGSRNAGKMAILENGLTYQQIGQGLKDIKFEDMANTIRDEILAIFGVPASKLGLVEDVNRANAEANDYTYQKETIEPRLRLIEEKLNEKLMPVYDVGLEAHFVSPVPQDKEFRLREIAEHIRTGYSSIDDERIEDNLEPYELPETEVPLIPFSVVPAGTPKPEPVDAGTSPDGVMQGTDPDEGKAMTKSAKRRASKWEMFAAITAPQERLMKSAMERYFAGQHSEVMRNLNNYRSYSKEAKAGVSANILLNANEQNEKLKMISRNYIREALLSGAGLAGSELGIDFNLIEPNVLRAVDARVDFFAAKVNEATVELLADELKEALTNGETIDQIAKRVDKVFDYSEKFRSIRTARTEIIGANNAGQLQVYSEAGIEHKQWITARDEKVRLSHQIDGQTVGITEDFVTNLGNHLQYPGDRTGNAPPEDLIQCRCSLIAVRTKE
jgi:HK97 family phage portal protein